MNVTLAGALLSSRTFTTCSSNVRYSRMYVIYIIYHVWYNSYVISYNIRKVFYVIQCSVCIASTCMGPCSLTVNRTDFSSLYFFLPKHPCASGITLFPLTDILLHLRFLAATYISKRIGRKCQLRKGTRGDVYSLWPSSLDCYDSFWASGLMMMNGRIWRRQ